jgi:tripartite-type tricarboxylate transporter receptor subunit TctC
VLHLILAPETMDRPILAPPGVPPERVAALRAAFHAAMNDPGFIAEAKKEHLEIQEISGDRVSQIIGDAFALPAEVVKAATEAINVTGSGGG